MQKVRKKSIENNKQEIKKFPKILLSLRRERRVFSAKFSFRDRKFLSFQIRRAKSRGYLTKFENKQMKV